MQANDLAVDLARSPTRSAVGAATVAVTRQWSQLRYIIVFFPSTRDYRNQQHKLHSLSES